jgi:phosphatidate cytidylyltransferase
MLVKRTLVSLILLPAGLLVIAAGGWIFVGTITLLCALAAWEYVQLFRRNGDQPAGILILAGTALLLVGRAWDGFESAPLLTSLLALASITWHVVAYERGRDQAASDFAITLAGIVYFGWIGGYLISLRQLPDGEWWFLLALPALWLVDSGAYMIGSRFGKHKLSKRISPRKSWEGYFGGLLTGAVGGALLALLWTIGAGAQAGLTPWRGALIGVVMGLFTVLGDLGESMVKRQVGAKDSGNLLPGHGGAFDRIDSWLWAGVLGYYLVVWMM